MSVSTYILPILLILLIIVCIVKKVKVYECFLLGARDGLNLVVDVFPYIATIFVCIETFKTSGLADIIGAWFAKPLAYIGIPSEVSQVLFLVPLSGNGTIGLLQEVIDKYGADSYAARCAAVIAGGSETIFYISAVYFSTCKVKKLRYAIPVSLFCTLLGALLACVLCRFM